jgi:hypothetical protein
VLRQTESLDPDPSINRGKYQSIIPDKHQAIGKSAVTTKSKQLIFENSEDLEEEWQVGQEALEISEDW